MFGAALAMGLALLFPAGFAGRRRTHRSGRPRLRPVPGRRPRRRRGRTLGLVPAPVSRTGVPRTHFAPLMARFPDRFAPASPAAAASPLAAAEPAGVQADPTPAAYDLRTAGRLSPVRDQGRYGTCWAFAALASLESSLLPGAPNDFSENNLAQHSGFALGYDSGGNSSMAAAYLLRWAGPVSEADDPYAPYAATPNPSPANAGVGTHVHEVLELPSRKSATDNADLKWAVMTYGAVYASMCWSDTAFRDSSDAYYYAGSSSPNHAVTLVGLGRLLPGVQIRLHTGGAGRVPRPQQLGHGVRRRRLLLGLLPRHAVRRRQHGLRRRRAGRRLGGGSTSTTRSAGSPRTVRPAPPIRPRRGSRRRTRRRRRARSPPPASTPRRRTPPTRSASRSPWTASVTPP